MQKIHVYLTTSKIIGPTKYTKNTNYKNYMQKFLIFNNTQKQFNPTVKMRFPHKQTKAHYL